MEHEAAQYLDRLVYRGGVAFQALRVFLFLESCIWRQRNSQDSYLESSFFFFFFNFIMEMSHSNVGWNHHHFFRFEFFHNLAILVDRVCVLIPQILYKGFLDYGFNFFLSLMFHI